MRASRLSLSLRLGTIRGVVLRVDWTLLVILMLLAWTFTTTVGGHVDAATWIAAAISSLLVLACLALHEASHAVVARALGLPVASFTISLYGGGSDRAEAGSARVEFLIAAVGPLTSLILCILFLLLEIVLLAISAPALAVDSAEWLWIVNLIVCLLNILPAAPLDGGRIMRALLWHLWKNPLKSALAATQAGRTFGLLLALGGVIELLSNQSDGLWFLLIGFVLAANPGYLRQSEPRDLTGYAVGDVMTTDLPVIPAWTSVRALVEGELALHPADAAVVTDQNGTVLGIVPGQAIRDLPEARRALTQCADIMLPVDKLPTARPGDALAGVVPAMGPRFALPVLVYDEPGHIAGAVTSFDLQRAAGIIDVPAGTPAR